MDDRLKARLEELRQEHAAGVAALAEIQRREQDLRATLLRISGAIQVLEEMLGESGAEAPPPS